MHKRLLFDLKCLKPRAQRGFGFTYIESPIILDYKPGTLPLVVNFNSQNIP